LASPYINVHPQAGGKSSLVQRFADAVGAGATCHIGNMELDHLGLLDVV
jgi:hypothetical protein